MRETLLSFLDDCFIRRDEISVARWRGLRVSRWTYGQVAAAAFQFARELEIRGINKGDRVMFWGESSPEWIAAFWGCLLRGVVVVPLDVQSAQDFVERVQQQVSAKLLLGEQNQGDVPTLSLEGLTRALKNHSDKVYAAEDVTADDLIEIVFTSGTTADPKGVCLTHRNLLANLVPIENEIRKYSRWEKLVHPLRFLCLLPLSHVFGQFMGIFIPHILGAEVYFRESYKPSEIIASVRKQRINLIVTVPRFLDSLRDKISEDYAVRHSKQWLNEKLSSAEGRNFLRNWWTFREIHRQFGWRFWAFIAGGATLEQETEVFWRRLGFAVIQGYGMTETASLASLSHPFRLVRGSIGKPVAGQEVKLSETGEILVRGENVSPGYWQGGVTPMTDEQGWMHTGDLGEVGTDGNIFFRGRSKDTIVTTAGLKIFPEDLEAALDQQPEIRSSAVVPINSKKGTVPMAALIPRNREADLSEAVKRANASLAEFQRIRHWIVWPDNDFPRTIATGKIRKVLIAERLSKLSTPEEGVTLPPTDTSTVLPLISRMMGDHARKIDSSARLADDLKLDSLGRIELLSAVEDRFQIELDEAAITEATTVGDIEQLVRRSRNETVPYPYPVWAMRFPTTWIRVVIYHLLLLPITYVMCRVRVHGLQNLDDLEGPALLVSNHVTDVDAALIMSALPVRWRTRLATAMSGEILRDWRHPPASVGWFYRIKRRLTYVLAAALFNVFSLPKQSGFRRSFAYFGEAMDRGWSVLVFPEGQETTDGQLQPFMTGTGLLVSELQVPVVPIKLHGLFEIKRRRQFFVRPGTVRVTFGKPIRFEDKTAEEITHELEFCIADL